MKLRLVPHQPAFFEEYAKWCHDRGKEPQMVFTRASAYIWIEVEGIGLVLGVGLFESPAFVMAEELVIKPGLPPGVSHKAAVLAIGAFVSYCTSTAKYPIAHPESKGVARVLARKGFQRRPCVTMSREPFVQVSVVEKPKREPVKRSRKGPRRKKA